MQKDEKPIYEKITFPKIPNYNNVREYLFSKAATEGVAKKFENGDNIERSVDISYYLAQKDLIEANKRLEQTKKSSQEKRVTMNEQWAELRNKEMNFRENFIKFDEFVKENQEKRERAANKIIEQQALYEQRVKSVAQLTKKCQEITEVKRQMERTIGEYRIYENYLKDVIAMEPTMQTVSDLLKRYDALLSARKELNEIQQRDMVKLEKAKTNLEKLVVDYYIRIDALKTRLTVMRGRYEDACQKSSKWELLHEKINGTTCEQVQELVGIRESCRRIYVDICRRKKTEPIYLNDYKKQLECIKDNIGSLEKVNKMVEELTKKEKLVSIEAVLSEKFSEPNKAPIVKRRPKTTK